MIVADVSKGNGAAHSVGRMVNGAQAQYTPPARISKNGYPQIGEPYFIGYDQHDIDLALPPGTSRGVVFEPIEATKDTPKQFKATVVELTNGMHGTYLSLSKDGIRNNLRAFVMYAVPDGLENLVAPRPKVYNAATGKPVF